MVGETIYLLLLYTRKFSPLQYRGLLSSSCGRLKGPKVILADGWTAGQTDERTDGRTTGLRELDVVMKADMDKFFHI